MTERGIARAHTGIADSIPSPPDTPESTWFFHPVGDPVDVQPLIDGIIDGTAISVTDGSYKGTLGTAGMILLPHLNADNRHRGVNQTPGIPTDINPYRAELAGILGIALLLKRLCKQYDVSCGVISLACDCDSALTSCFYNEFDKPSQPNYDLVHYIRTTIAELPIVVRPVKVKGHRDRDVDHALLTPTELLNVEMDFLAKAYWETLHSRQAPSFALPEYASWSLWLNDNRLTSWDKDTLLAHIYKDRAVAYWFKKLVGTVPDHAPIDWAASQRAMKRCPTYRRLWQPKWLSGFVPTGKNLKRWKIQLSDACPRCGNAELSTNHTLRCPDDSTKTKWAALMTNLDEWLVTSFTHPDLRQGIITTLSAWHDHLPTPCIDSDYTGISELFESQQSLGPDAFIKGVLCSQWAAIQQRYYEWIDSKKTGLRWVSSLIKRFWDIAWDMWQHRMKIADDPDSATAAAEHLLLDNDITMEYQEFATIPNNPPRHLSRWFARPIEAVQTEDIDFKRQWLDAVQTSKKAIAEQ